MASAQDQQPTYLLWLVAVLFSHLDYHQAKALIEANEIHVNGQVGHDLLQLVHSGDMLAWQTNARVVDLDALTKANELRRRIEMFLGGPEAAYKRFL